jgi:hypothetical protein
MIGTRSWRQAVALVTAYATALQMLFAVAAFAGTQAAGIGPFHFAICTSATLDDGRGDPSRSHDATCVAVCAAMAGTSDGGGATDSAIVATYAAGASDRCSIASVSARPGCIAASAHRPRAPPLG